MASLSFQAVQVRREQQEQTAAIKIQSLGRMKMGRDEVCSWMNW